jgi:hypothetical protein
VFVFRRGDSRCCPSGGSRSRIWQWNGAVFTASAWWYGSDADLAQVSSPGNNIWGVGYQARRLLCGVNSSPIHTVQLGRNVAFHDLQGPELRAELEYWREQPRAGLRAGETNAGTSVPYPFAGMRCTVIRSGRGFPIDRTASVEWGLESCSKQSAIARGRDLGPKSPTRNE